MLGDPGTGKGTMCELEEIQLGWTHLSISDLLRAEQQNGGLTTMAIIKKFIKANKLAPHEIVVPLWKDAMERTTGKRNFLIDGFPRSLSNLEAWYEVFGRGLPCYILNVHLRCWSSASWGARNPLVWPMIMSRR